MIKSRSSNTAVGRAKTVSSYTLPGLHLWEKPEGCTSIYVQIVGGGGGGAGYAEGGGAGGYSEKYIDVKNVKTVQVNVGSGGSNRLYYGNAGDGGTTSFGSYLTATGGYGANRNVQHEGGRGGIGQGGHLNIYGGKGAGHGNSMGAGTPNTGGASYFGGGSSALRNGNPDYQTIGYDGSYNVSPGAGGSGGVTDGSTRRGNLGVAGAVFVHEYYE
jgi:hypothetical protein